MTTSIRFTLETLVAVVIVAATFASVVFLAATIVS